MKKDILIVGVGGQGTLLASRILGALASISGCDCKLSEVHGMAQRGGSVVTHVKIADKVNSPIISKGEADIILAFEKLEALRYVDFLKEGGTIIVNTQEIAPMPVITGVKEYPTDIFEQLEKKAENIVKVDAEGMADSLNNKKAVNTVMLGVLAKCLNISENDIIEALRETVKPKFFESNREAILLGMAQEV